MKDTARVDIRGDEEGHDEYFGPHFNSVERIFGTKVWPGAY